MNEAQRDVALFRYSLIREAADPALSTRQRGVLEPADLGEDRQRVAAVLVAGAGHRGGHQRGKTGCLTGQPNLNGRAFGIPIEAGAENGRFWCRVAAKD